MSQHSASVGHADPYCSCLEVGCNAVGSQASPADGGTLLCCVLQITLSFRLTCRSISSCLEVGPKSVTSHTPAPHIVYTKQQACLSASELSELQMVMQMHLLPAWRSATKVPAATHQQYTQKQHFVLFALERLELEVGMQIRVFLLGGWPQKCRQPNTHSRGTRH